MNNFIAYAKVENRKRGVYEVIPVKDIGWYLRRGG
jgi:ribosome biogenesis protein Nip4